MGKLWHLVKSYVFDAVIVLGAAGGVIEAVLRRNVEDAPESALWFVIGVQLAMTLPLLARRRFSFSVPVAMLVFGAAVSFVDGDLITFTFFVFLSVLTICFLLGFRPDSRQALAGLAIALAAGTVVNRNHDETLTEDYIFIPVLFTLVWIAGYALGRQLRQAAAAVERAQRAEEEREERARTAVAEERGRIARELHDVVAHSVSVMTVQAGAVRRLLREDQTREREALGIIETTGREALAEMRRMLGVLRGANEPPTLAPQPSMGTLGTLIEQVREAGLPVDYRVRGKPMPLPAGVDLSAYRIVQEALTNALKHAGPARATVQVRYRSDGVEIEVFNDGRVDGSEDGQGQGHGLVGMKERVALYGGTLESGPAPGGGFVVRARLPVTAPE